MSIAVIPKPLEVDTGILIELVIQPCEHSRIFGQKIPPRENSYEFKISFLPWQMRYAETPAGFLIDTFLLMMFLFWIVRGQKLRWIFLFSFLTTLITYYVFSVRLQGQFPNGVFGF